MKSEGAAYIVAMEETKSACADNDMSSVDAQQWWKEHRREFPGFVAALRAVCVHLPTSAVMERVFSLMSNTFDAGNRRALRDYIELSLMLQLNRENA